MKKGFATFKLDDVTAIRDSEGLGFDFVEITIWDDVALCRVERRLDTLQRLLDARGLETVVHLPFVDVHIGSPYPRIREPSVEIVKHGLDAAAALDAGKGVLHATTAATFGENDKTEEYGLLTEAVREVADYGSDLGVEVSVENLPGHSVPMSRFEAFLDDVGTPMTLDTAHARVEGLDSEAMASFVSDNHDRVSHVHLNDTRQEADEHLPLGAGTVDFELILGALVEAGWTGTLSLEVGVFDFDYVSMSKRKLDEIV